MSGRNKEYLITDQPQPGQVTSVEPGSLADSLGVRPGDRIEAVNGCPVQDVIDVQFYAADSQVQMQLRRGGKKLVTSGERRDAQALGLEFAQPTFDVDIRRCNNHCPFCFVQQMAPGLRRSLYVKDDDYRYSFLFGHYVTLTNLDQPDWARIEAQRLSPLYVSVHATSPSIRRQALGNPHAPDVLEQLGWLIERGIQVHTQLVITPGLNDGACLERSVLDLARLYPGLQSISIVPVGLTRHHRHGLRPNTRSEMKAVLESIHAWQAAFKAELDVHLVHATDEWYLALGQPVPPHAHDDDLELQENGLGMVRDFACDFACETARWLSRPVRAVAATEITLVTGTLFAPTLHEAARQVNDRLGTHFEVVPIINHCLGQAVSVAGLLTARDVIEQLETRPLGQRVLLPQVMFDHPAGVSLDDLTPHDVARALKRPVGLVHTMGEALRPFNPDSERKV